MNGRVLSVPERRALFARFHEHGSDYLTLTSFCRAEQARFRHAGKTIRLNTLQVMLRRDPPRVFRWETHT